MTGIVSYGVSIPKRRLRSEETIKVWQNNEVDSIVGRFKAEERVVLNADEDVVTMAVEASKAAIRNWKKSAGCIDALYFGTCSNPYDAKPTSTIAASALGMGKEVLSSDLQFSTKSGTSALQIAYAMVKSGVSGNALAIGSDAMNRHMEPGNLSEPFAGAGGAAVIVGSENVIAEIEGTASYNTNLSDDFRVEGERYIKSGMVLGSHKPDISINEHTIKAMELLLNKLGRDIGSYDYVVFQQQNGSSANRLAKLTGASPEQVAPSVYAGTTGDCGSASALIGLAKVLDQAKPGDRILVVSYGFGAGADAFSLVVTDEIANYKNGKPVEKVLADKTYVDYATAMKIEYKYLKSDYPLHTYL